MRNKIKKIRRTVQQTDVYQKSDSVHKSIISTRQNLDAIGKSLLYVQQNGIKIWEDITQNNHRNAEIIRELHIKNLEVNF